MSLAFHIFLRKLQVPTAAGWAQAIRDAGFDTQLDPAFDPLTHSGYLPCPDELTGFELYVEPFSDRSFEFDSAERQIIGDRDTMVTLRFSGRESDLQAATAAAAALTVLSDGVLYDSEAGHFIGADAAMSWARHQPYQSLAVHRHRGRPGRIRIRPGTLLRLLIVLALAAVVFLYGR